MKVAEPMIRMVTADHVAKATEHERTERAHQEACGKCKQREDVCRRWIEAGKELLRDNSGERAVEIKVVPLEHGAE